MLAKNGFVVSFVLSLATATPNFKVVAEPGSDRGLVGFGAVVLWGNPFAVSKLPLIGDGECLGATIRW